MNGDQTGQRLYGGDGSDTLFAHAGNEPGIDQRTLTGDELFGDEGNDFLYGNLRKDTLWGGGGGDFIHGDYNVGPGYSRNPNAGTNGGDDLLIGGLGQDQLFGGGGNDLIYGGEDADWLEGQGGTDTLRGGFGVDILVVDTDSDYAVGQDSLNGFGGNRPGDTSADQLEVDIALVQGDQTHIPYGPAVNGGSDRITLTENATGQIDVSYTGFTLNTPRTWQLTWKDANGKPLVEQFQISGLTGDDSISFSLLQSSADQLADTQTWVSVIGGGPGNDTLIGSAARDRLDGGPGSDLLFGKGGDDRMWGDTFNGSLTDIDAFFGGTGNDDMIGGKGANFLFAWSDSPYRLPNGQPDYSFLDPYTFTGEFPANFVGIIDSATGLVEDTGLNRALGSPNTAPDFLFGGTGLDFLYGNGPYGAAAVDKLFTKDGILFQNMKDAQNSGGDAWKEYAKSTNRAWYLAASGGNDQIAINYVTNPYNPFFGRHLVTFQTTGSFDPRFNGFDNVGAFDRSDNRVSTQGTSDTYFDAAGVTNDKATGAPLTEAQRLANVQQFGETLTKFFDNPEAFDAIIVDALGGDDTITIGETVQRTVWVDGGAGDDKIIASPTLAFLPDRTDPAPHLVNGVLVNERNDSQFPAASGTKAYEFAPIAGNATWTDLTIDSNRSDQPDVDWYKFHFATAPSAFDYVRVRTSRDIANLTLQAVLVDANGVTLATLTKDPVAVADGTGSSYSYAFGNGANPFSPVADTDYWLKVQSVGAIPTDYDVLFRTATGPDIFEANNSKDKATNLDATYGSIARVGTLTGLTVADAASADPEDWFTFVVPNSPGNYLTVTSPTPGAKLAFEFYANGATTPFYGNQLNSPPYGPTTTSTLTFNGFLESPPGTTVTMRLRSDRATRYELKFEAGAVSVPQASYYNAYALPSAGVEDTLSTMPLHSGTAVEGSGTWLKFVTTHEGRGREGLGIRVTSGKNVRLQLNRVSFVNGVIQSPEVMQSVVASASQSAAINFESLPAGTYQIYISLAPGETGSAGYELFSFTAPAGIYSYNVAAPVETKNAPAAPPARRDVYLGGPGNDTIQGGSGEDWLFGGDGNDLLTGGIDRQASDLIFGEAGDDRFQVIPDFRTPRPDGLGDFDNAGSDLFVGGEGNDRVIYYGLDGVTGRDYVVLGWDKFLHRYRVGALVYDTTPYDAGNPVQFPGPRFVYDANAQTWLKKYSYFQANGVEGMLVDTRGGADFVSAKAGFVLDRETWGVERGDIQNRAAIYGALEIHGGAGQDVIYGGAGNDVIFGEADNDYIQGDEGNDRILGDAGNDRLAGGTFLPTTTNPPQPSQLPPTGLVAGLPYGNATPGGTFVSRNFQRWDLAPAEPVRSWNPAGVSLPAVTTGQQTLPLTDAFAFEGRNVNDRLGRLIRIGDFNGDRIDDYLLTTVTPTPGVGGNILFGPLTADQLYRVDTDAQIDPSTYLPDVRVRGSNWNYTVSVQEEFDQTDLADSLRVGGQAQYRIGGLSPTGTTVTTFAQGSGDLTNNLTTDPLRQADIVQILHYPAGSISGVATDRAYLGIIRGESTQSTNQIGGPSGWGVNTQLGFVDGLPGVPQAYLLNRNGTVGSRDLLIIGSGSSSANSNGVIGYLYMDPDWNTSNTNAAFPDLAYYQIKITIRGTYAAGAKFSATTGDFNNDGRDDIVIGVTNYQSNGTGRVYLLPGDVYYTGTPTNYFNGAQGLYGVVPFTDINLNNFYTSASVNNSAPQYASRFIWEAPGLGTVYSVGDVTGDGRDEIAFGRAVEPGVAAPYPGYISHQSSGAFVIRGEKTHALTSNFDTRTIYTESASNALVDFNDLNRYPIASISRGLAPGQFAHGAPSLTTGDFDGDGRIDLAVGYPSSVISTSLTNSTTGQTADANAGKAYLFRDLSTNYEYQYYSRIAPTQATTVLTADGAAGQFGTFAVPPRLDLNGDRIDDLLVAAPTATVTSVLNTTAAGRLYAVFGGRGGFTPPDAEYLTNRDVPGSGLYLVEQSNGQPYRADAATRPDGTGTTLRSTGFITFSGTPGEPGFAPATGDWAVAAGQYVGTAPADAPALALLDVAPVRGSYLFTAASTQPGDSAAGAAESGLVFDYASPQNYKFATLRVEPQVLEIYPGHFETYYRFIYELGDVAAGTRIVRATTTYETQFSHSPMRLQVEINGSKAILRSTQYDAGFPESGYNEVLAFTYSADDALNVAQTAAGLFVVAKVGLTVAPGQAVGFDEVALTETDRWYRFTTLGDGRVGDQIKLLTSDGTDTRTSRPAPAVRYATDDQNTFYAGTGLKPLLEPGRSTAIGTFLSNGSGSYPGLPADTYAVSNSYVSLITLDLTTLLGYVDSPELITAANLQLFFNGYTGPTFTGGSLTIETFDEEPDRSLVAADALNNTTGPHSFKKVTPLSTATATLYQGAYYFGDVGADLGNLVRQSLARGQTRIGFKISVSGLPGANELRFVFGRAVNGSAVRIDVAARNGVLADVYDAKGRQLAAAKAIVDMRDFPAGDYYVRVFDAIRGTDLPYVSYWTAADRISTRMGDLRFRAEIEAPKVGDADVPVDRDELRGGPGNDVLSGGNGIDRLFGLEGVDSITGKIYEFQDQLYGYYYYSSEVLIAPPSAEDQLISNGRTTEDVVVFANGTSLNPVLNVSPTTHPTQYVNQIAQQLGVQVAYFDPLNSGTYYELLRPIYASDLSQIVELNLRDYVSSTSGSLLTSTLTGFEYLTNVEYLRVKPGTTTASSNLAALEVGLRAGRESQGVLGLKSLRFLDLKDSRLTTATSQVVTTNTLFPLAAIGNLTNLEYLNLDRATVLGPTSSPNLFTPLTTSRAPIRWLSAEGTAFTYSGGPATSPNAAPAGNFERLQYFAINGTPTVGEFGALLAAADLVEFEARDAIVSPSRSVSYWAGPYGFAYGVNLDALRGAVVIDNRTYQTGTTTNYTETGPWTGGAHTGAFQGDYRLLPQIPGNAGTSPTGRATYTFSTALGAVYATWPSGPTHTDRARYRIEALTVDSDNTLTKDVYVNQAVAPRADLTLGGRPWQKLYDLPADVLSAVVTLTNAGTGHLVADGVQLRGNPSPDLRLVDVRGNATLANEFFDYTQFALEAQTGVVSGNASSFGTGTGTWYTPNPAPVLPDLGPIEFVNEGLFTPITIPIGTTDSVGSAPVYEILHDADQFYTEGSVPYVEISGNSINLYTTSRNAAGNGQFTIRVTDGGRTTERTYDVRLGQPSTTSDAGDRLVNTTVAGTQTLPEVAVAPDGSYVVTWQSNSVATGYDIFFQRYDRFGQKLGTETLVNATGLGNTTQSQPDIGMDAAGNFVITWQSNQQSASFGNDIYARRYAADGTPAAQGPFLAYSATQSRNQTLPQIAVAGDGSFTIVWIEEYTVSDLDVYGQRFYPDGTPNGGTLLVATSGSEESYPDVAADPAGNFLITYNAPDASNLGVFARRFDVTTGVLGTAFAVNTNNTSGFQTASRVAFNSLGESVVTWVDGGLGNSEDVFLRRYKPDGTADGPIITVDNRPGTQTFPSVALDDNGAATVFYFAYNATTSNDVFVRRFGKGGWSTPLTQVNLPNNTSQALTSIAVRAGHADYVLAWASAQQDNGSEFADGVYVKAYQFDGVIAASPAEVVVNAASGTANDQTYPRVAASPNGRSYVVYQSQRTDAGNNIVFDVYLTRFDATGANPSSVLVATSNTSITRPVVAASDATVVVVWARDVAPNTYDYDLFSRRYAVAANGSLTALDANPVLVNEATSLGSNYYPDVAMAADGRYAVAWGNFNGGAGTYTIAAKRFLADGAAQDPGGEFVVSAPTANYSNLFNPSISMGANGAFALSWDAFTSDGQYDIFARRYAPDGTPVADAVRVNTSTSGYQRYSNVAMLTDGDAIVAWSDVHSFYNSPIGGLVSRRVLANGTLGALTQVVPVTSSSSQGYPSVTAEPHGRYAIAWQSPGQNAGFTGSYARRFDADDTPIGPEIRLADVSGLSHAAPRIASANGTLVATWMTYFSVGNQYDIALRRFAPDAVLSGVKRDLNGNPVEGVTVFLDRDGDGSWDVGEEVTATAADGTYAFRNLPGGTTKATEIPLVGTTPTASAVATVSPRDGGLVRGIDFQNTTLVSLADRSAVEGETLTFTPNIVPFNAYSWTYDWSVREVLGPGVVGPVLVSGTGATFDWAVPDDGTYRVFLNLSGVNLFGGPDLTTSATASVVATNAAPTNSELANESITIDEFATVSFPAGAVDVDADLADMTYEWSLTAGGQTNVVASGTGPTYASLSKTFGDASAAPVVYTVRYHDDADPTVWFTRTITVTVTDVEATPVIDAGPLEGPEGGTFSFNGSYVGDPDPNDVHNLWWDILDESNVVVAHGTGSSFDYSPSDNGTYTARLTVSNGPTGNDVSTTRPFTVANVAPSVNAFTGPAATSEEIPTTWTLSFADPGTSDTHTVAWEVRDTNDTVVASGGGAATVGVPFDVTWTPLYSGHYTVHVTVTDDDAGTASPAALPIVVRNVRPRQVSAGADQNGTEGTMVMLTGEYRDPALAEEIFTTNWLVSAPNGSVVASGFGTSFGFTPPDDRVYTATFTVTNALTGLSSRATSTVTAAGANPTGSFVLPAYAAINEPLALTVANGTDPSPEDVAAGLRYAFDLNNDGIFDIGDGSYAGSQTANSTSTTFNLAGSQTLVARVIDKDGRFTDYTQTVTIAARPTVETVQINDGSIQRSRVTSITVTFDSVVNPTALLTAFVLRRQHDQATIGSISVGSIVTGGKTVATLTFSGTNTEFTSLADGRWKLEINAAQVRGNTTDLPLGANYQSSEFFRMFGDANGNARVTSSDYAQFSSTFGKNSTQPGYLWLLRLQRERVRYQQ